MTHGTAVLRCSRGKILDDLAVCGAVAKASLLTRRDRIAARARPGALWQSVGDDGDALHRMTVAHALADAVDDVATWDQQALDRAFLRLHRRRRGVSDR